MPDEAESLVPRGLRKLLAVLEPAAVSKLDASALYFEHEQPALRIREDEVAFALPAAPDAKPQRMPCTPTRQLCLCERVVERALRVAFGGTGRSAGEEVHLVAAE